ncbi:helix-turn-helix transcriptional regulator [Streptomyces omiyaensis]|uniref:helix-turn-helix transcriptional regulator n=1 Tax=Streptomyces omiyaensis TaxID=68247 RepID=UPI0036FC7CC9
MVGRAGQVRALLDAVASTPAVVLVEGEAGIGKTRLLRETLGPAVPRAARGRPAVLYGICRPLREPFPYGPLFDVLRALRGHVPAGLSPVCGALAPYLPELSEELPDVPGPLPDGAADRHRVFRAVREVLAALGPAVLVVEDLHWADDGTRDLLRFLADDPPPRLVVLLSHRRAAPGVRGAHPLGRDYRTAPGVSSLRLLLEPLDAGAVGEFAAGLTGVDVAPSLARALCERTGGVPYVLEEVVHALGPAGLAERAGRPGAGPLQALPVPVLLREAMEDRLAELSPPAVALAHAAAVLQVPSSAGVLAAVAGQESGAAPGALREILLAGVLLASGDDTYGFRHPLAQQAVYEAVLPPDRSLLHRRAREVLGALDDPPHRRLAHHARRSGDLGDWWRCAGEAAEVARARGDTAVAVELLEELLSGPAPDPAGRTWHAVRLSRLAVFGLAHQRSAALLRRVLDDGTLEEAARGEIRLNLGLLLNNQAGNQEQGRRDTELAATELARHRPALAARAMAGLAMPGWGDHPRTVYEAWMDRAEALLPRMPGERALHAAVRGNRLSLRVSVGDPGAVDDALSLFGAGTESGSGTGSGTESGTGTAGGDGEGGTGAGAGRGRTGGEGGGAAERPGTAERRELARTCGNLMDAASWIGRDREAERFRREGVRLISQEGEPFLGGIIDGTVLRAEWHRGAWDGLDARARRVLRSAEGATGIEADAHLVLALLALAGGRWEESGAHLGAAALADPANASAPLLAAAAGSAIRLALLRDEPHDALAEADRIAVRLRRKDVWAWAAEAAPMMLVAWLRAGRRGDAERFAAEFAAGTDGRDTPLADASLLVCRALLARASDPAAASALFLEAAERYGALPRPYPAARATEAGLRCGPPLAGAGERLAGVTEVYERLGATHDAARCRSVLRAAGTAPASRRGRRGYGSGLSPREEEVARLASDGRTNREIAEVLFLSPRTVEQHVARALRKVGARDRSQLADRLRGAVPPQPSDRSRGGAGPPGER